MWGEVDLVGAVLQEAGAGAIGRRRGPQRRIGLQVLQVFEDLRGIEDFQLAVDQDGHLALRIDAHDLGVLGLVEALHLEGHHDQLDIEALLEGRDLGLGAEHAERAGIEAQAGGRGQGVSPRSAVDRSSMSISSSWKTSPTRSARGSMP